LRPSLEGRKIGREVGVCRGREAPDQEPGSAFAALTGIQKR